MRKRCLTEDINWSLNQHIIHIKTNLTLIIKKSNQKSIENLSTIVNSFKSSD